MRKAIRRAEHKIVLGKSISKEMMDIPASVEHIGHERRRSGRPGSIDDICHDSGEGGGYSVCDDGSRR